MNKQDLISYSPVRYFEVTNAALKDGEMGLITAQKGLGKTSVLVQFGIDSLLQDKGIVHISFDQQSANVITWYTSILSEIVKRKNLNFDEINEDISRSRIILNFNQETFTMPKVVTTLKALKEGGSNIGTIIVDGLNIANTSKEDLDFFADFIKAEKLTAWFSYTSEADKLKDTLPANKIDDYATVAHLSAAGKLLSLSVLKNGTGTVNLDTKTLLMTK